MQMLTRGCLALPVPYPTRGWGGSLCQMLASCISGLNSDVALLMPRTERQPLPSPWPSPLMGTPTLAYPACTLWLQLGGHIRCHLVGLVLAVSSHLRTESVQRGRAVFTHPVTEGASGYLSDSQDPES